MRYYFYKNVQFCPKCGVRSLLRDLDKQGHNRKGESQINDGTEWWCTTCGFSFRISKSHKWAVSDELHRRDRMVRDGKFEERVDPKVKETLVKLLEQENSKTEKS